MCTNISSLIVLELHMMLQLCEEGKEEENSDSLEVGLDCLENQISTYIP